MKAVLSFHAVNVPAGCKKPELIALLSASMKLPTDGEVPELVRPVEAPAPAATAANEVVESSESSSEDSIDDDVLE